MEHCTAHDQVVGDLGEIKANVSTLLDGQAEFRKEIKQLSENIGNVKTNVEVEKTKIQPVYIVLGIIAVLVVTKIGEKIVLTVMKLFPFFKD